ncbi:MAG TPA: hypothetical protein VEH04_16855 [Verrucomicrobiae bacterium]|nr:hypothetical protein [Verrucomicrobiae bacterium]
MDHTPAIINIEQAVALVNSLVAENDERSKKNARIQEKYNAERPFNPAKLKSDGLDWKSNFTTKPLASLIDKVVPRFTTALRNVRYLTASKLPDRFPQAAEKTEFFRREITEFCRGREGWDEFLSEIAHEDVLFGYTAVGWLTTWSWFPEHYRQDCFLVPQGTKHSAKTAPIVCLKKSYLLHELFDLVRDPEAAKAAGWNVPEVIKSINEATPDNRRSTETDVERVYADLARESSVLSSFTGATTINAWHVLVSEVDGRITHVAFDANSKKQLFWKSKKYDRMSDAVSFYSFQHGNGNIHGSKGIGRELYAMAGVLDRARNEVVDRLQLSGKLVLQCDEKFIKRFRMSVVGNAILIATGYNVQQAKIDGGVESFFALDSFLTDILDQVAGSTSPKVIEGERVTKAQVELLASREEERRDAIIERFLTQFSRMMSTVQRRACDPRTLDDDAKELQARLLTRLTQEELAYISTQPAVSAVNDYSEAERQQIALIAQEGRGNPLYNQYELEKRSLTAKVSAEFADKLLLPQNDPTEEAENVRLQKLELLLLQNGHEVPISPRDNHLVHMAVVRDVVNGMLEMAVDNPQVLPTMQSLAQHAMAHFEAAQAGKMQGLEEFQAWIQKLSQAIGQLAQIEQEAAATAPIEQPVA